MVLRGGFEQFFNYYSSVSEHAQMQACHNMHTIMRASWLTAACYRLSLVHLGRDFFTNPAHTTRF